MVRIAPSFLAADIWRAAEQIQAVEAAGCDILHLDIMDGHFVPNISYGAGWVKGLRPHTQMEFDAHLMIENAEHYVESFAKAGADYCTVHAEATYHIDRLLHQIKELGMKPGLALNPGTPLSVAEEVLPLCELVLIMSVNPGFGGQKFINNSVSRLERLAALRAERGLDFVIQVDGGVTADNAGVIAAAGADILVAGSAVFGKDDVGAAFRAVAEAAAGK